MIHPIAWLFMLLRMVRAAQGLHASPDGYARGLSGEFRRRRCRSRRVRRYAERVPFALAEDEDAVDAECSIPPRVPAPRRPMDAVPQVDTAPWLDRAPAKTMASVNAVAHAEADTKVGVPVPAASVAVPAALVRGRCFVSGRDTGARPVESRKLALTVLCALADQEQAQAQASTRAPEEGFALGQSPFLEGSRPSRQGTFAGSSRPAGAFERAEFAAPLSERAVLAGREAA